MRSLTHLLDVVKRHKLPIALTYAMLITEVILFSLVPYLMGLSVDSLLKGSTNHFFLYLGIVSFATVISVARRRFDTRTFMKVWREKVMGAIRLYTKRNVDRTKIISRAALANTYGSFFEHTIPSIITAVIDVIVAIIMIALVVPKTAMVITLLVLIAIFVQHRVSNVMRKIEMQIQDLQEQHDGYIVDNNLDAVDATQATMAKLYIKNSDIEAACWRSLEIISIIVEVIIIFSLIQGQLTAGMILATVAYGRNIFDQTNFMNYLFTHIREIQVCTAYLDGKEDEDLQPVTNQPSQ